MLKEEEGRVGVMASKETFNQYSDNIVVKSMGSRDNLLEIGSNIFEVFKGV